MTLICFPLHIRHRITKRNVSSLYLGPSFSSKPLISTESHFLKPGKRTRARIWMAVKRKTYLAVPELPGEEEDLDERERHGDQAKHEVGDGQVDDVDVPRRPHPGVPGHDVDDEEVARRAQGDHDGVEEDHQLAVGCLHARLERNELEMRTVFGFPL